MVRFLGVFILGQIILASQFVVAAPKPMVPALTLKESLRKGMSYSPKFKRAQAVLARVHSETRLAKSDLYPEVNAVGQAQKTKTFSGEGTAELYSSYLELSQPLYSGGKLLSGLSAAKVRTDAAELRLFAAKQTAAADIIKAYLDVVQTQSLLALARDNVNVLKTYYDITTKYAAIGRSKDIDRLQAQTNYALGQSDVLLAESNFEKSLSVLERMLGEDIDSSIKVDINIPIQTIENESLSQLLAKAVAQNPELKALESDVEFQKHSADVTMASHRPKLDLSGQWGYRTSDRPQWLESESNYYAVGLKLTVPIFSGLSSLADRQRNSHLVNEAEKNLFIFRDEIKENLTVSLGNIKRDFERVQLAQGAAESARKAMAAALRDYRRGLISSNDVLSVQRSHYQAEQQFSGTQFSYQSQVLNLRLALGVDLEQTYSAL